MGAVAQRFGDAIAGLQAAIPRAGAVKFGHFETASLLMTLDKHDFNVAKRTVDVYKHIPYYTGGQALWNAGRYITGNEGPIARYFNDESGPEDPWKYLSDRQVESRGTDRPILDDTGALRAAVTDPDNMMDTVVTGQYARLVIGPKNLTETDNVIYKFFVHQLGSSNGWGRGIPIDPRPFLPTDPSELKDHEIKRIKKEIHEGIQQGIEDLIARRR